MRHDVLTIIVTYNPDWEVVLKRVISFSQSTVVFVSDNSAVSSEHMLKYDNVIYHFNNGNVGIAKAQNIGVEYALTNNFNFIAFVDDDSNLNGEKINQLLASYDSLGELGKNIAALCAYPSERGGLDKKKESTFGDKFYLTNNLMSSGSLTRSEVFKHVGLFNDKLFIDYVDYEWGWRALANNYFIVIDSSVHFEHSLGQGRLGSGLGIPSPIRHFYQTRNLLWISRLDYVPGSWKLKQLCLLPIRFVYFGFIYEKSKIRRAHFLKGLAAGLKSKI
ncbi:glycosyltransferase [Citrobacter sedlakii]|uniref:Glycosyltransferase n=1 Tax=Citrobacter sedlakii TaxID=67826 RepID=A0ABS0ZQ96_9ENTR|nr:glycosyltransferase [Citrobacter sedlakii]MBJ8380790.1 glycosyltransferase [Citrobacter sedlakii]HCT5819437.1 glycosyltransferase [Citrobacter sedlakii]